MKPNEENNIETEITVYWHTYNEKFILKSKKFLSLNDNESKSNGEHRVRNNLGKIELWKFVKHYIIDSGF